MPTIKLNILLAALLLMASCGNYEEIKEIRSPLGALNLNQESLTFANIQAEFLQSRCQTCHPNYANHSVVASQIDQIVNSVLSERMPKAGPPLSDEQKNLLQAWAQAGAPLGQNTTTPPPILALQPTWESISTQIIFNKCIACHNPNGQVPFLDFSSRNSMFAKRDQLFDFDHPEESPMIEVILDPLEPMPPLNSGFAPLTSQEIQVLIEWIGLGLP